MYGIFIEFDFNCLKKNLNSEKEINNFIFEIKNFMKENNFKYKSINLYIGKNNISSVETIVTIQKLIKKFNNIKNCIKTAEMLYIKEINDLIPAINNL